MAGFSIFETFNSIYIIDMQKDSTAIVNTTGRRTPKTAQNGSPRSELLNSLLLNNFVSNNYIAIPVTCQREKLSRKNAVFLLRTGWGRGAAVVKYEQPGL